MHLFFFLIFLLSLPSLFQQSEWFPLTSEKPGQELPDKPRNIDRLGYRDAFSYQTVWKGKKVCKRVNALAYWSGMGGPVAFSFSTLDSGCHWDMVPEDDSAEKWYLSESLSHEERQMKGFQLLAGSRNQEAESLLLSKVEARTCGPEGQGSREWFIDRMFSGTSSTIHAIFKECVPLLVAEIIERDSDSDNETMEALDVVMSYIDNKDAMDKIKKDIQKSQQAEEDNSNAVQQATLNANPSKNEAISWIEKLSDPNNDMDDTFKRELESTMQTHTMEWIIALTMDTLIKVMTPTGAKKKI